MTKLSELTIARLESEIEGLYSVVEEMMTWKHSDNRDYQMNSKLDSINEKEKQLASLK